MKYTVEEYNDRKIYNKISSSIDMAFNHCIFNAKTQITIAPIKKNKKVAKEILCLL